MSKKPAKKPAKKSTARNRIAPARDTQGPAPVN